MIIQTAEKRTLALLIEKYHEAGFRWPEAADLARAEQRGETIMVTQRVGTRDDYMERNSTVEENEARGTKQGYAINALKVRNRELEDQLAIVRAFLDMIENSGVIFKDYPSAPAILVTGLKYVIRRGA